MSTAMQQVLAAQRQRTHRNYFVLVSIVLSLIPGMVIVLAFLPEGWEPRNVLLGFVLLGVAAGFFIHRSWAARQPAPRCPSCGTNWEIVEGGGGNAHQLKPGGQCPKCGLVIQD